MKSLFILLLTLVFFCGADVFAGSYISEEIPPDSILAANTPSNLGDIIGKFKHNDNEYTIYFNRPTRTKCMPVSLIRLDTNIWLFRVDDGVANWRLVEEE